MKIEEIYFGCWYYAGGYPARVVGTCPDGGFRVVRGGGSVPVCVPSEDLDPIPMTGETLCSLLKGQFQITSLSVNWPHDLASISLELYARHQHDVRINGMIMPRANGWSPITAIHELQALFRLCTGREIDEDPETGERYE